MKGNKNKKTAIAEMTARFAQRYLYMSALKIVCKHKISRRLRKHITILSLFGGEAMDELWKRKK